MPFIDTHLHLYTEEFNSDRNLALERAINNRINTLLLPNIDVESILPMKQLLRQFPKNCYGMMGLHPCSVKENYKEALAIIKQELYNEKYIAVGEIGTDLYWDKTTFTIQQDAFITQCQWALELNLPIAVHCRESVVETIDLVKQINKSNSQKLKGVFHCFSGSLEQAKELIDMDFYLGIGGVVTFKNGKIDKFLNQLPIERIVLETD
ncbi:MAG: TatD family hydrolase, partial [Bacteroidia bacterium]|nr:TatD family hydrolase [Bacteroidia bacterium]